ncbi:hypothetical protein Pyrde_1744 [Pyrodictium delaneyi]|uniref:MATE family efflux transporter n=1 Tax=Pyrodictium delaneyi TaxID=1273541 RepID=A0A0P0N586_9CREN|nr:MATE family efflux transporter [Pyrodictium delaneyi]ALL01787.1 hypothetical protein Pyrde_1744 [Pyrodictium delaneyi]
MTEATKQCTERGLQDLRQQVLEAPVTITILKLSAPLMLGNLVSSLYWLIDAFWLGLLGVEEFSVPTLAYYPFLIVYTALVGFLTAAVSLVSQITGRGNVDEIVETVNKVLGASILAGLMFGLAGFVLSPLFVRLIGASGEMAISATTYLRLQFIALPVAAFTYTFRYVASSLGDTRTPMILMTVSMLINIVLDPFLIFGLWIFPRLEVLGAAIATVVAKSLTAIVIVVMLRRGFHGVRLHPKMMLPSRRILKVMISVGTPLGINMSVQHVSEYILVGIITRIDMMLGTVAAIAAYTIGFRILDVLRSIVAALSQAAAAVIGQSLGAGLRDRAETAVASLTWMVFITLVTAAILLAVKGYNIAGLFIDNPAAIMEAWQYLFLLGLSLPLFTFFLVAWSIGVATGKNQIPTYIAVIRTIGIRLPLAYTLAFILGMTSLGVWIAIAISNMIAGLLSALWIVKGKWLEAEALRKYQKS